MATAAATAAAKAAISGDVRSGEALEHFVGLHSEFFLTESDLLANVAISLEPRLIARLRRAGLDEARILGMGSTASAAAKSVTRHFKVAAELQETASRAMRKAWSEYLKNIQEPIIAAEQQQDEFQV